MDSKCLLLVRNAGQQRGICSFEGDASIMKPSFDMRFFTLVFLSLEAGSPFVIFYSVDYLLSVSAHKLTPFLCLFQFIPPGLLASEPRRDILLFPSSRGPCSGCSCFWCTSMGRQRVHSGPDSCEKCSCQCRRDATDPPERCFLNF